MIDFCIKGPGKQQFEGPLFQCIGGGAGLPYPSLSNAILVPAGSYEIRSTKSADCTAIASGGATLTAGVAMTVLAFGGGVTGESARVTAFENDPAPGGGTLNVRFVHGLHKAFPIDIGLVNGTELTATVLTNVFFASVAPAGPGTVFPIDSRGYLTSVSPMGPTPIGVAPTGTVASTFTATVDVSGAGESLSVYGVGIVGNATFPPRFLVCHDDQDVGFSNSCVTAM